MYLATCLVLCTRAQSPPPLAALTRDGSRSGVNMSSTQAGISTQTTFTPAFPTDLIFSNGLEVTL